MPQEGKTGQYCLLFSSFALIVCGIACLAATYSATDLVPNSLTTACEAMGDVVQCASPACTDSCKAQFTKAQTTERQKCFDACEAALDFDKATDACLKGVLEGLKCICPTDDPDDCDCEGSDYQAVDELWRLMCSALGALGLVGAVIFTGIPAGVSGWKRIKCINVVCFSACSALWSLVFIACGAGFITLSVMLTEDGPIGSELMKVCSIDKAQMEEDVSNKAAADLIDCAAESLCRGITTILDNLIQTSTAVIFGP